MSLADFEKMMNLCVIPEQERGDLRTGAALLERLGWPENYIDFAMCRRAAAGLVPRYESYSDYLAYKQKWWSEDQAARVQRV